MLSIFQSSSQELSLMQTSWAKEINPLLTNPMLQGSLIRNVTLAVGDNEVNHKLGRKLQGWTLVRKRAAAEIYDKQDSSIMPHLTLSLTSDAVVTVDLYVF